MTSDFYTVRRPRWSEPLNPQRLRQSAKATVSLKKKGCRIPSFIIAVFTGKGQAFYKKKEDFSRKSRIWIDFILTIRYNIVNVNKIF